MPITAATSDRHRRAAVLLAIAIASIVLWQTEIGGLALYPFTLLATWFHEMGHGIAAMLTGSRFDRLVIFPDGSGYASIMRPGDGYAITDAFIATAGPIGPAVAGALLIIASQRPRIARDTLTLLGVLMAASAAIWIRSPAGLIAIPLMALAIIATASLGRPSVRTFAVQLLGIQACISVWHQLDYLFTPGGRVSGLARRSDTGAIADALMLPYWFWGGAISIVIAALLWWSFRKSFR